MSAPPGPSRPGGMLPQPAQGPALGASFVAGIRRHPILGPAFDAAANAFGYDRERLRALEAQIGPETGSEKVARFVGEVGPDFLLGGGIYSAGRKAGLATLQAVAEGRKVGQLGLVAARAARDAELAAGQLGALRPLAVPWSETLAKALGGQTATAAYFGGSEYLRSGDTRSALKAAGVSAAIGAVLEGVPTALGSLTGRARAGRLDQEALRARAVTKPLATLKDYLETGATPTNPQLRGRLLRMTPSVPKLRSKLQDLSDQLALATDVDLTSGNLVKASELQSALEKLPGKIKRAQQRLAAGESLLSSTQDLLAQTGADIQLTTDHPFVPKGLRRVLFDVGRQVGVTPESLFGRFGASAARMASAYSHAEMRVNLSTMVHHEATAQARATAMKAIGLNPYTRNPEARELLWRIVHEYESTGDPNAMVAFLTSPGTVKLPRRVSRAEAEQFRDAFLGVKASVDDVGARVQRVGAEPALTAEDHAALGTRAYWPHLSDPSLNDVELAGRLEAILGTEQAAHEAMAAAEGKGWLPSQRIARQRGPTRETAQRVGRFGSFDFARTVKGTGWEKLRQGMPLNDDPFDSASRMLKAGERRYHFAQVVGPKGELVDVVADAVESEVAQAATQAAAQGAKPQMVPAAEGKEAANLFTNIMDELLDHRYYNEGVHQLTRTITSFNVASKLALSILPQLTQPQNNAYMVGLRATFAGFKDLLNRETRQHAEMALAIPHITNRAMSGALDAGVLSQRAERFAENVLRYTGFEPAEKFLRIHSYTTGNAYFRDSLLKAANGRLRGGELDHAFRALADLGVDLKAEVEAYRAAGPEAYFSGGNTRVQDLIERVGYRTAQQAQFVPSKSRRPVLWNSPWGRVLFQFKTFALHQARLIKDQVFAEAALGNVKPLAYFLGMAPLSGAFIVGSRNLFRDKPFKFDSDAPPLQVAQLFMSAGGFGVAGDMLTSALHGDLKGLLAGPTIDQTTELIEGMVKRDSDALLRLGLHMPLTRLATTVFTAGAGATKLTTDVVREYLDASRTEGPRPFVDLGSVLFQQTKQKLGGGS